MFKNQLSSNSLCLTFQKMGFFGPVIDGKFIPKDVDSLAKERVANPVPYIIGYNNTESCGILSCKIPPDFVKGISKETCYETLKSYFGVLLFVSISI